MSSSGKNSEKQVKLQEKFQAILSAMLREEDNKYCVDCDAKGPRWASWNLGVFLCIRCAGIHRNLGVHISKVKSVNLDQWTAEQIASMQAMGNSRGRAVYEANLSDNFRRSQNDSAMEQFIRSKYEARKWIAKEWIPPSITELINDLADDESSKEKGKTTNIKSKTDIKVKPSPSANTLKLNSSPATTKPTSANISKAEIKVPIPKNEPAAKEGFIFDFEPNNEKILPKSDEAFKNDFTPNFFTDDIFNNIQFPSNNEVKSSVTVPNPSAVSHTETLENIFIGDNQPKSTTGTNGKIDKQSILDLYKNTTNNANIFANPALIQQNQPNNLLKQPQANSAFEFNNQMMPQTFIPNKPAQQHSNNNNFSINNFNAPNQFQPNHSMNILNLDISQMSLNPQSKPSAATMNNPYLASMKPTNFNGGAPLQPNQLNFNNFPNANTASIMPNIGNTLSTDLWQ